MKKLWLTFFVALLFYPFLAFGQMPGFVMTPDITMSYTDNKESSDIGDGSEKKHKATIYEQISIVGKNTSYGAWPEEGDGGARDIYLSADPIDDHIWTITGLKLTKADTSDHNSGIRFRANHNWNVSWGANNFPAGRGYAGGPNIMCEEGTWDVVFNSLTGEYSFELSNAGNTRRSARDVRISYYADRNILYVDLSDYNAKGDILINLYEMNGKLLLSKRTGAQQKYKIRTRGLEEGDYFLSVSNHAFVIAKKFTVSP